MRGINRVYSAVVAKNFVFKVKALFYQNFKF